MEIVIAKPPIWARAAEVFPLSGRELYAYGDIIYNPGGFRIPPWLIAHEEVHQKQTEECGGPEKWWDKYLTDTEFRFDQELPAQQREYRSYCAHVKDRNARVHYLTTVARKLAAPLYGSMISVSEAKRRIK